MAERPARAPRPAKRCLACGRSFAWRRKWARDWERVLYCSRACRARGAPPAARRPNE